MRAKSVERRGIKRRGNLLGSVSVTLVLIWSLMSPAPSRAEQNAPVGGHSSCAVCHRSEGGPRDCLDCHAYILELPGEGAAAPRNVSGHVASGAVAGLAPGSEKFVERLECVACHDPHVEDAVHLLRDPDPEQAPAGMRDPCSDLCLDCHSDFGNTKGNRGHFARHPVGVRLPAGSTVRESDFVLPLFDVQGTDSAADDVVSCATCHTPHVAPHPDMLRWPTEKQRDACATCHDEGRPPGARTSG